jgi:hypothetical protein
MMAIENNIKMEAICSNSVMKILQLDSGSGVEQKEEAMETDSPEQWADICVTEFIGDEQEVENPEKAEDNSEPASAACSTATISSPHNPATEKFDTIDKFIEDLDSNASNNEAGAGNAEVESIIEQLIEGSTDSPTPSAAGENGKLSSCKF